FGGMSGPAIKPIALRCVYQVHQNVKIPLMGVGGITDYRDVVEFLYAGASCVQIGTAVMYHGLEVFQKINTGLEKFMKEKNYQTVEEMVGLAHQL
ncbi:MAG: nitronate monooxygenase, partial [Methanobacterium sp.]|nr:nitronate monooxygenase [Methanobacterium sp.]